MVTGYDYSVFAVGVGSLVGWCLLVAGPMLLALFGMGAAVLRLSSTDEEARAGQPPAGRPPE